jgi:anthranilate phosphoribosyltransferase
MAKKLKLPQYTMSLSSYLERLVAHRDLSSEEALAAMRFILGGEVGPAEIGGFLIALRMKGETAAELAGFARAMRERAERVECGPECSPLVDTCGTGGDGASTFNISTIAAFVVAGAGVRVAKHGNRSITSRCGSADVLEELGVKVGAPAEEVARAIREVGIGFLFAPAMHSAMRHAQPVRVALRVRTVFNLLGPLTNPAGADAQVAGAPSPHAAELMAGALAELGLRRGFVVHGSDGLDEITTTGPTLVFSVARGSVERMELSPADFGVSLAHPADLRGGDKTANAVIARAVLSGEKGPQRDIVLANASAALVAAGAAAGFAEGVAKAARSIDSGAAQARLEALAAFTNRAF